MERGLSKVKAFLISIILLIIVFQNTSILPDIFNYTDEVFSLLFLFTIIFQYKKISFDKNFPKIVLCLLLFIGSGLIPYFINMYQGFSTTLIDMFTCIKFFLSVLSAYFLVNKKDSNEIKNALFNFSKILICFFACLAIIEFFGVYRIKSSKRYGIEVIDLFFDHPTFYAASVFLITIIIYAFKKNKKDNKYIMLGFVLSLLSLRTKTFLAVGISFVLIIFLSNENKKQLYKLLIPGVIFVCVTLFIETYELYFHGDYNARRALLETSIKISKDYLPFGTGFGTFGSFVSGENYSKVYYLYRIDHIWGISSNYHPFLSDSFWPMILGQTGVIGLCAYVLSIIYLLKIIRRLSKINDRKSYIACLLCIVYLLVSSTGESAFVNPINVGFAFVIGVVYKVSISKKIIGSVQK